MSKYCTDCGSQNDDRARFCRGCGKAMSGSAPSDARLEPASPSDTGGRTPIGYTEPPSDLPAAAVSELVEEVNRTNVGVEDGFVGLRWVSKLVEKVNRIEDSGEDPEDYRTVLTVAVEMIHKGTLKLDVERRFIFLEAQPGPKFAWEQALCDGLLQIPLDISTLRKLLNNPQLGIRQHLREYLQDREMLSDRKVRAVTNRGRTEGVRWLRFGEYLGSLSFSQVRRRDPNGTDPFMPYAFALNRMDAWNSASRNVGLLREDSASESSGYFNNPKKVGLDAAMLLSPAAIGEGGLDLGSDFDLSL